MTGLQLGQECGDFVTDFLTAYDSDEIDVCATCGEIVCDHTDAEYLGLIPSTERR